MTNLDNATIGQVWKDSDDIVWLVSAVNDKNKPKIVFFERPSKESKDFSVDRTVFSLDEGWEMIAIPAQLDE